MALTDLLREVLSIDDQTKLIDGAPTRLTSPYGARDLPGLLGRLVGSEEGMGLANKALEKASSKNPAAREYIKMTMGGGSPQTEQATAEAGGGGIMDFLSNLLGNFNPLVNYESARGPVPRGMGGEVSQTPEGGWEEYIPETADMEYLNRVFSPEEIAGAQRTLMQQGIIPTPELIRQLLLGGE